MVSQYFSNTAVLESDDRGYSGGVAIYNKHLCAYSMKVPSAIFECTVYQVSYE